MLIAIDGACRRNGKPDCISSGGIFITKDNFSETQSTYEYNSTSQRGEISALILALKYSKQERAVIITDSEYLFNTMYKEWLQSWSRKGWVNATGSPVKNKDLWEQVLENYNYNAVFFHIKGHVIPFGKVTTQRLLQHDMTGKKLAEEVRKKFVDTLPILDKVTELSSKNNGFIPDLSFIEQCVVMNTVADAVATYQIEQLQP